MYLWSTSRNRNHYDKKFTVPGSIRLDVDNDLFPAFEKYANDPELGEYVVDLSAGESG